jgi:diguanylate cyclase (GGDEF)-like protein
MAVGVAAVVWPSTRTLELLTLSAAIAAALYSLLWTRRSHRALVQALDEGVSILDRTGRVRLWNDALERMLDCPRTRALGRSLADVLPILNGTGLPKAVDEVLRGVACRKLVPIPLSSAAGRRMLQVKVQSAGSGAVLCWQDVTGQQLAESALKRAEERLALVMVGASDGLWEWDLGAQRIYLSTRWKAMVGLPANSRGSRPEDWLERVHPDDIQPFKQAIEAHLAGKTSHLEHEHRIRQENGTYRSFLCHGVAVRAAGHRATRMAGSLTAIGDRPASQERIRLAGFHDPLTGLANRTVFVERLGRLLADLKQHRGDRFAVLYLDLDRFKVVNDSLGHLVGDELLTVVSRRLESCLREGDALARLGGDEFAILLHGLGDELQANALALRIQGVLCAPFSVGGREVFTSASIGIAFSRAGYDNPEEIMRDADTAMYHAKASGKARHELFDADMHAEALDRLGIENDLRHAVKSTEFDVHYQPIVSLASGLCTGFEALVRWNRNGQPVSPAKFIPIAEELGLIEPLGTWVMHEACRTFAGWRRRYPECELECIAVNVSARQLKQSNFLQIVQHAVHRAGLKPCDLRVEITETTLMDSPHVAAELLRDLRNLGVKIYLDDFGTGFSSLSHLHRLPVDALKIDRSFVMSLLHTDRPAIVESVLALARTLSTSVVAEGVESDVQARELLRLGCPQAQGFFFSPPLSARSAEEMLAAPRPLGRKSTQTRAPFAAADDAAAFSSVPFEWPGDKPRRPGAGRDSKTRIRTV